MRFLIGDPRFAGHSSTSCWKPAHPIRSSSAKLDVIGHGVSGLPHSLRSALPFPFDQPSFTPSAHSATRMQLRSGRRSRQQQQVAQASPPSVAALLPTPPQPHSQQQQQEEGGSLLHLPHHLLCELYKLLPADGASRRAFAHSCRDAHDAVGGVGWGGVIWLCVWSSGGG